MYHSQNFTHDIGIHNGIEHFELVMIGKSDRRHHLPVQFPVRRQDPVGKALLQVCQTMRAACDHMTGNRICINEPESVLHKDLRNSALSSTSLTGQTDHHHTVQRVHTCITSNPAARIRRLYTASPIPSGFGARTYTFCAPSSSNSRNFEKICCACSLPDLP